jgi:hypothetical protein
MPGQTTANTAYAVLAVAGSAADAFARMAPSRCPQTSPRSNMICANAAALGLQAVRLNSSQSRAARPHLRGASTRPLSRSCLGTSIGIVAPQAGEVRAPPTPSRNVVASRREGFFRRRDLGDISTPRLHAPLVRASGVDPMTAQRGCTESNTVFEGNKRMANPWLKKNPLMSMWLSSANAAAGRARSIASAETSKQQAELTKQTVRFWTRAWQSAAKPRRHR